MYEYIPIRSFVPCILYTVHFCLQGYMRCGRRVVHVNGNAPLFLRCCLLMIPDTPLKVKNVFEKSSEQCYIPQDQIFITERKGFIYNRKNFDLIILQHKNSGYPHNSPLLTAETQRNGRLVPCIQEGTWCILAFISLCMSVVGM